jgi:hypothetical protein
MSKEEQVIRNGGLALAVGAGIALAIGSAGSAWAAPNPDSSATSVREEPSAHSASAHSTGRGPHKQSASLPSSPRTVNAARAAAAQIATPRPAAPKSAHAPRPSVPAAAVAVAQAGAPAQGGSSSRPRPGRTPIPVSQQQMTITILPKIPLGLPPTIIPWVKQVNGFGTFTKNSVYDLNSADQNDWNKLSGISFAIPGDVNSTMVAWRYNVTSGDFEVAPFFNVDKARILPTQAEIITVPIGDTFDFHVDYDGITIGSGDKTVFKATPTGLTPNFWTSYRTSVWFGGTSLPPNLIQLKLKLKPF